MHYYLLTALLLFLPVQLAFAVPGDQCFEVPDGTWCGLYDDPWGAMLAPFDAILTVDGVSYTLMVMYGIILGVLWLKTNNMMLIGIVGVLIASLATGINPEALAIGALLFAISIGIVLYQLIQSKIRYPA